MIPQLLPHVQRILTQRHPRIIFLDVGARNGILELRNLAPCTEAHGFEPNPEEFEKLMTGRTDHFLAHGGTPPAFQKIVYWPFALGERSGRHEFFLTPSRGACGMLEPNVERLKEFAWEHSYRKQTVDDMFAGTQKTTVEVRTLDHFAAEQALPYIDYLKIDVEGSEYEVLAGARAMLPKTGVIRVETCFIPARKGQKLFSHVDLLLREFDFDLLRYEIGPTQVGFKERTRPIEFLPPSSRLPDPFGQPFCCDAIYVNRQVQDEERALTQVLVLIERNYLDEALHILRRKTSIDDPEFFDSLRTVQNGGAGQRLRMLGYRIVDGVVETAARIARAGRR